MKDQAKKVQELQKLIKSGQGKALTPALMVAMPKSKAAETPDESVEEKPRLEVIHEQKLLFKALLCNYTVLGSLPQDFSMLQITLYVSEDCSHKKGRYKLDLYEPEQCRTIATEISNLFSVHEPDILNELTTLTELLEQHRDEQVETQQLPYRSGKSQMPMFPADEKAAIELLSEPDLIPCTDLLLERAGIQESLRLLLYVVGLSYKSDVPLHIGIRGNNGTVRNLINNIGDCLPPEDLLPLTNISGRSFYHSTHGELVNKIMLLPNGVDKKAGQALKQLQQGEVIATATTVKDRLGNMRTMMEKVNSHFSSLLYLSPNEEHDHIITASVGDRNEAAIHYYNDKAAGLIDEKKELKARELLQNMARCIKPMQVVNPYAGKIAIPVQQDLQMQTNIIYHSLVRQVCLMHQYQRSKDEQGRLIAQIEDMRIAADLLYSVMAMEGDELEPVLRNFYERVKSYVKKQAADNKENYRFTMREIRQQLKMSKTSCFRFMGELQQLEYVKRIGYANKGFKYEVSFFDDVSKERENIKSELNAQFKKLESKKSELISGTPVQHFGTPGSHASLDNKGNLSGVPKVSESHLHAEFFLNDDATTTYEKPTSKAKT